MIRIDRIRMRLPPGFQHRATTIARLVGDQLAKRSVSEDASLDAVSIGPGTVSADLPDADIAHEIVQQIIANIEGRA